jgi:hypothetical protein
MQTDAAAQAAVANRAARVAVSVTGRKYTMHGAGTVMSTAPYMRGGPRLGQSPEDSLAELGRLLVEAQV